MNYDFEGVVDRSRRVSQGVMDTYSARGWINGRVWLYCGRYCNELMISPICDLVIFLFLPLLLLFLFLHFRCMDITGTPFLSFMLGSFVDTTLIRRGTKTIIILCLSFLLLCPSQCAYTSSVSFF